MGRSHCVTLSWGIRGESGFGVTEFAWRSAHPRIPRGLAYSTSRDPRTGSEHRLSAGRPVRQADTHPHEAVPRSTRPTHEPRDRRRSSRARRQPGHNRPPGPVASDDPVADVAPRDVVDRAVVENRAPGAPGLNPDSPCSRPPPRLCALASRGTGQASVPSCGQAL